MPLIFGTCSIWLLNWLMSIFCIGIAMIAPLPKPQLALPECAETSRA